MSLKGINYKLTPWLKVSVIQTSTHLLLSQPVRIYTGMFGPALKRSLVFIFWEVVSASTEQGLNRFLT